MLHDIASLKLQGKNFESLTELSLFNDKRKSHNSNICYKGALLFGRNGSGKSTVAKSFRKIAGEAVSSVKQAIVCDYSGNELILSDDEKKHIFVFDEEYVDKNIKLQEDHLNTIVLLGEAANLTGKIAEAEKNLAKVQKEYERQQIIYDEYNNANDVKSPKKYKNDIYNKLKGDKNWAGRDRQITGNKRNASVDDKQIKKILKCKTDKSIDTLSVMFHDELNHLHDAMSGNSKIQSSIPEIPDLLLQYEDESILKILAQKIEKPNLTEREIRLLKILQDDGVTQLEERKEIFSNSLTKQCPYCMQPISEGYKTDFVKSIQKVLNEEVKKHQKILNMYYVQIDELNKFDFSPFHKLQSYEECVKIQKILIEKISIYNEKLKLKEENPYLPILIENQHVNLLVKELCQLHLKLKNELKEYNENAVKVEPIKNNLKNINAELAYLEIRDLAKQKEKQQSEFSQVEKNFKSAEESLKEVKKDLDDLQAKRKNVHIAVNRINACMQYIFFSKNRLSIKYSDSQYKLFCRGKPVRPCDVSVGERNILALSYFFTNILQGKSENKAYKDEYLLIIDDPVSSFDMENHVGILSFLKYELGLFLEGNRYSRCLLMTHDLMTFSNMDKMIKEINSSYNNKYNKNGSFCRWKLDGNTLNDFVIKTHDEYGMLVRNAYKFALGENDGDGLVIGNELRQLLEAFATFEYTLNIENVSTNESILKLLPNKKYQSYFKNLMYRLVLHGGSHKKNVVNFMKDYDFFSCISMKEKQRTARDVLCFIYLLNPKHLLMHLENKNGEDRQLNQWCTEIQGESPEL
ncbi:AAA family ATPase [Allisonella histaminiformans]|uniref:AAA family ATPase n=1 Tax=Allisonella histaminiformans TaxID=209880 RepID=UPI002E76D68C|nr:AAA family ATPase [Allisonella histaminiformans]